MSAAIPYPPGFEPFVAAMQADIDADLPRLTFADWLDDHGDPDRAEFIRLQCGLTRWDRGGLQGKEYDLRDLLEVGDRSVTDRLEELFAANRGRWLGGLPTWAVRGADWMRFQRGFIGRFQGGLKQFLGVLGRPSVGCARWKPSGSAS